MRKFTRSPYADLDRMVMAPALPNLSGSAQSDDNNPPPGRSKVDTGVSFTDHQEWGVWNFLKRASTPHELLQLYRTYRDSEHCTVPKDKLRRMRDILAEDFQNHSI